MTNLVFLEGNITREPDARINDYGTATWSTTLAVPEVRWDAKEKRETIYTNWIFLTARADIAADLIDKRVDKSCKVQITGKIGTYVKETGGAKETKTQVEVTGFQVLRRPAVRQDQGGGQGGWGGAPQGQGAWDSSGQSADAWGGAPQGGGWGQEPGF